MKRLLSIIAAVLSAGVSSLGLTNSSCAETRKLGGMMIELPAAYDTAETSSGLTLKKIARHQQSAQCGRHATAGHRQAGGPVQDIIQERYAHYST